MLRSLAAALMLAFIMLLTSCGADTPVGSSKKSYNVLIIMGDDFGQQELPDVFTAGTANYTTTPNIDALAASGVVFDRFYVEPQCGATRNSLATGQLPLTHGNVGWDGLIDPTDQPSIFRGVKDANPRYATGAFGKIGLWADTTNETAALLGVDRLAGNIGGAVTDFISWAESKYVNGVVTVDEVTSTTYLTDYTTDAFESWVTGLDGQPWFAWVSYNSPHQPVHDPVDARAATTGKTCNLTSPEDCFKAQIEDVDAEVGEIVATLTALGELDNTLICFLGDNGADIYNGDGKATMFEAGVNVGMVCGYGPIVSPGRILTTELFSVQDLWPLMQQAVGGQAVPVARYQVGDPSIWSALRASDTGWGKERFMVTETLCDRGVVSSVSGEAAYRFEFDLCQTDIGLIEFGVSETTNLCTDSTDCSNLKGGELTAYTAMRAWVDQQVSQHPNVNGNFGKVY
ncbi:MAG: sulfatase-like hydrolase/transferase [Deltaproteobacteria bacterium]|nr:sulfatase-like hydrolase/transferase [Deltaproteobacteria bacterium]MBW2695004.1 sulfatase-like hydrolase/transferase [Deltaproteobacteria bacterium]